MNGKLILITIPSSHPQKSVEFYSAILGIPFARSFTDNYVAYHAPVSRDGLLLQIQQRFSETEKPTLYFSVDNLDEAAADLQEKGATVLPERYDLAISERVLADYKKHYAEVYGHEPDASSLGTSIVVKDLEGDEVGLIDLHDHADLVFKTGDHHESLHLEQIGRHLKTVAIGKQLEA
jgi:predicted enzyme related to lactoylglutathione lyase